MKINPSVYKPKTRGQSDKYSWNLYRVLNDRKQYDIRVYKFGWHPVTGICDPEDGELRIFFYMTGNDDVFTPSISVTRATALGPKAISCCVSYSRVPPNSIDKVDVTDWFFREYARIGRCLFQGDLSHDFIAINKNSRKCRHCGKHQTRSIKTTKKIKRTEVWA